MDILILILGFLLLIKGADFFVDGSSSIAKKFKIPPMVIGLTLVAFGTSAPELAVSIDAALALSNGLVFGNVIGSNIANTLLILGLSAAITPISISKKTIFKEMPFLIVSTIAMAVMAMDKLIDNSRNLLSRVDGMILLLLFVIYFFSMIEMIVNNKEKDSEEVESMPLLKSSVLTVFGLIAIVMGADLTVTSAVSIAALFGLSETLIGLTVVAVGTSLPELITSVVAAKKGENDIAIGNIIGSNVFNILLVLGVSAIINPIIISSRNYIDLVILIIATVTTMLIMFTGSKISKWEGRLMYLAYFGYIAYLVLRTVG